MSAKAALISLCLAQVGWRGEAARVWDDSAGSALDFHSEHAHGLEHVNSSASLKIQCALEIKALEESVRAKVQLPPGSITKLIDGMLDLKGFANYAYGLPTNLVHHDCSTIISGVFNQVQNGWWHVQAWKGQCNSEDSCLTTGLREVGLTVDYFTDEDWESIDNHFFQTFHFYQDTCSAYCDYYPECKQCKDDMQKDKCVLYKRVQTCRSRLLTAALCHCAASFTRYLASHEYGAALATAAESMKGMLVKHSDENQIMNKECKHAPPTIPGNAARVKGISDEVYAVGDKLYLPPALPLEGAVCGQGYSCQPSRVWRNPAVAHYAAPLLVGTTYAFMKVAEFSIVVVVCHLLCGPGWFACWSVYATSIPASELAIGGVVAGSKGVLSRQALACLPTRCVERSGRCEVPGPDPQNWKALIQGARCTRPVSKEEDKELQAEVESGEERKCRLEFCPEGEEGNGPQEDGALWHCGAHSSIDPKYSLVAKAKRLQQQKANTCEDDGVDASARVWFRRELLAYRRSGAGCIAEGASRWLSGEVLPELEDDDAEMYTLFEAARKQNGYICTKGCPAVPPYLVDKGCMKESMDPKIFMRGVWKKAAQGPLQGCKAAFMKVFLCDCVAAYNKPVSSHKSFSQNPGNTLEDESSQFEKFLDKMNAAQ